MRRDWLEIENEILGNTQEQARAKLGDKVRHFLLF